MEAKATKKTKTKSHNRRTHCSIDKLPLWLCETLMWMLVDNKWPDDFGTHYDGAPRYIDLVQHCKKKGFTISRSAIGRFAKRIQALPRMNNTVSVPHGMGPKQLQREGWIQDYVLSAIAVECKGYCEAVGDLHECLIHPGDHPEAKSAVPQIRKQANEKLVFIEQAIKDLRAIET